MSTDTLEYSELELIDPPEAQPKRVPVRLDRRQTILVVDDDDALTDVLSHRLQRQGFATLTAESGEGGLALAREKRPTLIILDVRLPDIDGLEVCEQLVDDPATCDIPVIILSGCEKPDILRSCRAAGCWYFLRKPYDPNALLTLIQQAINEGKGWV